MRRRKPVVEMGTEGWLTRDPDLYRWVMDNRPPRRFTYLEMLRRDIREPKLWLVWAQIAFWLALGVAGIALGERKVPFLAFAMGAFLGWIYLMLLRGTVHMMRHEVVRRGTALQARSLPRWWEPEQVLLQVITVEGKTARVSLGIGESLSSFERHGAIEVLFLQPEGAGETPSRHPESAYTGFAYRPLPEASATPP